MNFLILDISLMVLFLIFVSLFLYRKKKEIKKEGVLWLYHTKWGVKIIKKFGEKNKKLLKILSHVSVWLGYALMAGMIWLFIKIVWIYIFNADVVRAVKIPPIMPLIPYLPQVFKLDFLPPFYFTYWIVILAVIAITHEFFHGIFAAANKVETKTTGFGFFPFFFPIFLAAFVNLNNKIMEKRSNFSQRAILSAGTFANILTAILGVLLLWGLFAAAYVPSGVVFDDYAYDIVNFDEIMSIDGIPFDASLDSSVKLQTNSTNILTKDGTNYVAIKSVSAKDKILALYRDAAAINANLYGPIVEVNNQEITTMESFQYELGQYSPGQTITLTTEIGGEETEYEITLGISPEDNTKAWIGVVFFDTSPRGLVGKISSVTTLYKEAHVYYAPKMEWISFIYDLIWWLILISFSVALVNMLPVGIFDGGRFFYLTVLAITKNEKVAEKSFKGITKVFLALLVLIMVFWVIGIL
ncbi:site-2 protease family protein [archaeon]|jgi:membrane-associated protease RseP (regulator of RpoE activity)|nr:site-2 protease family protein [archaeon]